MIVGLRLASAAAGLIVIGLLWYKSLARLPKTSPNTDEGGMLMMSLVVTTALVLGAVGVLVGITIRQLRRS